MPKQRVAILISGRGANMVALIAAATERDYPAEIAVVLSNRPDAAGLARAGAAGIAAAIVDHTEFGEDREGSNGPCRRCWTLTASTSCALPAFCGSSRRGLFRGGAGA